MALVILAHPNFDKSIANKTIIEELHNNKPDLEIRNIMKLYPDYKIDVQAEQQVLLQHQTIIFQYPFYWLNIPAILKHWIDEVFQYQFAYGSQGDKLKGKNFLPSFTVGATEEEYKVSGKHHMRIYEFCKSMEHTAYYTQMNYIDPICFFGTAKIGVYSEDDIINRAKEHAGKLINCLAAL